ncbi:hypothetical protein BCR39DRAFT_345033 [Naematelia encephala]|uniref:NAD(P)-binding protein n=1 Tax=Naematelia encephala TaxID=71784 RepID=A0A1Y2AN11_9TREE|nr:hypothetical protein BCR39DRAFT_345033 [Naematelia encephala]
MPLITRFIASQLSTLPQLPKVDLSGRVYIVTGANCGIGLEIVRHLVPFRPGKIILACRNFQAGEQARAEILRQAPDVDIEVWKVDLASFASVKAFAKRCHTSLGRLDGVAMNAGMMGAAYQVTEDGHEIVTQVNALSPIYLALLLVPLLRKTLQQDISAKKPLPNPYIPRIIFTASRIAENSPTKFFDPEHPLAQLDSKEGYRKGTRYDESKLVEHSLVRHLIGVVPDLVITSTCPGFVDTPLYRDGGPAALAARAIGRSSEVGARSISHAILLLYKSVNYYADCKPYRLRIDWMNRKEGKKFGINFWKESLAVFEQSSPGLLAAAGLTS